MKVKICGLTSANDARMAALLGASEIGCILVPGTPRAVTAERAREVFDALPLAVRGVLVFRDAQRESVERAVSLSGVRTVQLHQTEEAVAQALEQSGLTVRRVLPAPAPAHALHAASARSPVLIDVDAGGSGRRFEWSSLANLDLQHVFVAGGITPENVHELVPFQPGGIDVSSGVEDRVGHKSAERLNALFDALRRATFQLENTGPLT